MTLHSLTSQIVRFFSWLQFERPWTKWLLLMIAAIAIVLLISTVVAHLRARAARIRNALQPKHWRQV